MSYITLIFFPPIEIFGSKMNGHYQYEGLHIKRIKLFNKNLASIMYFCLVRLSLHYLIEKFQLQVNNLFEDMRTTSVLSE